MIVLPLAIMRADVIIASQYHNIRRLSGDNQESNSLNQTCDSFDSCRDCVDAEDIECYWCSSDSSCSDKSNSCSGDIFGECEESYYIMIFIIVASVLICMCCGACYLRHWLHSRNSDQYLGDMVAPLLPHAARSYLFRNSFADETGEKEWMCVICGFDNKPRSQHCSMCGTEQNFSRSYKDSKRFRHVVAKEKILRKRKAKQLRKDKMRHTKVVNNNDSDALLSVSNNNEDIDTSNIDIPISADAQINSVSMSLRFFSPTSAQDSKVVSASRLLTATDRAEAMNYRRLNELSLRQKSARRRKLWQRRPDPSGSGQLVWVRVPISEMRIAEAPFGYTPRPSLCDSEFGGWRWGDANEALVDDASTGTSLLSQYRGKTHKADSGEGSVVLFDPIEELMAAAAANSVLNSGSKSYATGTSHGLLGNRTVLDHSDVDKYATPSKQSQPAYPSSGGLSVRLFSSNKNNTNTSQQSHKLHRVERGRALSQDSFGDEALLSTSPGFTSVFDEQGQLVWQKIPGDTYTVENNQKRDNENAEQNRVRLVTKYVAKPPKELPRSNVITVHATTNSSQTHELTRSISTPGNVESNHRSLASKSTMNYNDTLAPVSRYGNRNSNALPGLSRSLNIRTATDSNGSSSPLPLLSPISTRTSSPLHHPSNQSAAPQFNHTQTSVTNSSTDREVRNTQYTPLDLSAVAAMTYRDKLVWFLDQMSHFQIPAREGFIKIGIRRQKVLEDAYSAFMQLTRSDMHKWFRMEFLGEPGLDAGGLEREFFELVNERIFSKEVGLFDSCTSDSLGAHHISPIPMNGHERHLSYYHFVGRFFGKAIMEQQPLRAHLSVPFRKQILSMPVTFSDLEFIDAELFRNLIWLKTNDSVDQLMLDFTVTYRCHGHTTTHDLKPPNGQDITVTDDNKDDYLQLRLRHRMLDSIKPQLEYFLRGLYEVIPPELLSVFDYQELDLLLCGVPDIDIEDWKRHTEYMGLYRKLGAKHHIIKWFWTTVESMSHEERVRLLQFTTGCSRLPAAGFKALQSTDGRYRKFNIQCISKQDSVYPRAHTCFNKLDLPWYDNQKELEAYLSIVVNLENVTGFSME